MNNRHIKNWVKVFGCCTARVVLAVAILALSPPTFASTPADGVSEERLSLPQGPGSLGGIGENISLNRNMGQMQYSVPLDVPAGFPGMTPSLALTYSSGNGNSVAGVGWTLDIPSIERLTVRGLPSYGADDEFSLGGGEELVRVSDADPAVYRARFENAFIRYTWHDVGAGAEGYWTAEYPDGRIGYFGADSTGTIVAKARVTGDKGTFRYLLVSLVDRYGHHIDYDYDLFGNKSLPVHIGWVFKGGTATYDVTFVYEDRTDKLSDCKAGFEELLEKRLKQVNVLAHGTRIRRYVLSYEDVSTSGGLSRLVDVQMFGSSDGAYPIHDSYEYQRALGVDCQTGDTCEKPYIISMGSLGVDMQKGTSTLVDLNGDSLPDLVDTSEAGKPHRIFLNVLEADGTHNFTGPIDSTKGNQGGFDLGSPYVQVLDVDGDGFIDMLNAQTGQVLYNRGTNDWTEIGSIWSGGSGGGLPDLNSDFDPSQGSLRTVRFFDYDNDKRIDVVRSEGTDAANQTFIYRNTGTGAFNLDADAASIGAGFESDRLELNDMNGDGILDVVLVNTDQIRYRLNLGWGQWGNWMSIPLAVQFTNQEAIDAELDDLNGDGLADLILVQGTTVRYWLNRNGTSFDPERDVDSADVNGEIPERTASVTLFQADMNGNGSNDIVWIDGSGKVTYLELFPSRPNLLSKITNGIGRVTQVTYASSVAERANDAATMAWTHPLPFPMAVVKSTDESDELTMVHSVTTYTYHDGYYDGTEKRFRGYSRVQSMANGDDMQEAGATDEQYDVGVEDAYRAGLLLRDEQVSGDRLIQVTTHTYADCTVAGINPIGLLFPVRHVCKVQQDVEHQEGLTDQNLWITTATKWAHDGYGNVTLQSELGVTSVGGGTCDECATSVYTGSPCGAQCLGDERYTATTYITPDTNEERWITGLPVSVRMYGKAELDGTPADAVYSEAITYYDGNAFTGLPAGQADHGTVTRMTERVNTTDKIRDKVRNRLDADGNVIETLDALGTVGGDGHRRLYTMDADGLRVVRVDIALKDTTGAYGLRQEVQYDPIWDKPIENTAWMVVVGDAVQDARNSTYYTYDEFGRITASIRPGDSADAPTETYTYDIKSPASRVITHSRTMAGGTPDLVSVRCMDGRGREFQHRNLVDETLFQVSGFMVFSPQGLERAVYDPYISQGDACDTSIPDGVVSRIRRHDALGRLIGTTWVAVGDETTPIEENLTYGPLTMTRSDANDTDPASPFADTPTVVHYNGLGRTVAVDHHLVANDAPLTYRTFWDALGFPTGTTDAIAAERNQENDLLGRVVKVTDSDSGTTTFEYDDADNQVRRTDGRDVSIAMEYDGANRIAARWAELDKAGSAVTYVYDRRGTCAADKCTNVAGHLATAAYPLGDGVTGADRHGYTIRGKDAYLGRTINGHDFEFLTSHDAAERVTGNTYPTGRAVTVSLDGADRITAVPGFIDKVLRDERGLETTFTMANGVVTTIDHDARMRLASMDVKSDDGNVLVSHTFSRDRMGNVLEVTDGRPDDGTPSHAGRFTYDGMYRLTKAELDPGRSAAETLTFAYDTANRLVSKESSLGAASIEHVGTLAYGDGAGEHAVTRAGSLDLGYDGAGQMIVRGDATLNWDHMGRLVSTTVDGVGVASSAYDPEGVRIRKREGGHEDLFLTTDFEIRDGMAITYVQLDEDRRVRIEEPAFAADVLPDLAPASGPDTGLTPAPDGLITAGDAWMVQAAAAGTLDFTPGPTAVDPMVLLHASARRMLYGTDPRIVFLHVDSLGSTVAATDDQGALLGRAEFYPYGQVRLAQGEVDVHGFTGKEVDKTTGLLDFGARYLDPMTGRWTAPDPSFQVQGDTDEDRVEEATSAYAFVDANPLNSRDPDGEAKVGSISSFMGKFKMARALMKGSFRPSILYHYRFNLTPNQKINFKTAWKMVKSASGSVNSGGRSGEFVPRTRNNANDLMREIWSAGHTMASIYKTQTLTQNDGRVNHFSQNLAPKLVDIGHSLNSNKYTDNRAMLELHAKEGFTQGVQDSHINQKNWFKGSSGGKK
jgi:RHS repeat-associated protein